MTTTPQAAFALGDRVRTLIDLDSADWAPEQPDIPAGALGTVDYIHPAGTRYGVMLDASVDRLSASMEADEIEAAGGAR